MAPNSMADTSNTSRHGDALSQQTHLCMKCHALMSSSDLHHFVKPMFLPDRGERKLQLDYHNVSAVSAAARKGCTFCRIVESGLVPDDLAAVDASTDMLHADTSRPTLVSNGIEGTCFIEWSGFVRSNLHFNPLARESHISKNLIAKQPERLEEWHGIDTSSEKTMALAGAWLENCFASHTACQLTLNIERTLPTPLLEIDLDLVRLVEGGQLPVHSQYMTLSLCWRDGDISKLTTDSALWRDGSCLVVRLTQTFQDALLVTRKIGCKYLWIDSLCIIQDSDYDKRIECSRMCEVYANSYCTIAATASSSSQEGLIRKHHEASLLRCTTTPPESPSSLDDDQMDLERGYSVKSIAPLDLSEVIIEREPLCNRGWVVQERLLSPRLLHFCNDFVWWECRCALASEMYPDGVPLEDVVPKKERWDPMCIWQQQDAAGCYRLWYWVIEYYSKCLLTFPEDKLKAIAGVAQCIDEVLRRLGQPDLYMAGLWRKDLVEQLYWLCSKLLSERKETSNQTHVAPSWSWASITTPVTPMIYDDDTHVTFVCHTSLESCDYSHSGDDFTTAAVTSLRLRGPLQRVYLRRSEEADFFTADGLGIDVHMAFTKGFGSISKIYPDDERASANGWSIWGDREVYILLIRSIRPRMHDVIADGNQGLVLEPDGCDGTYRRIGAFHIQYGSMTSNIEQTLAGIDNSNVMCERNHGDGTCTITLV